MRGQEEPLPSAAISARVEHSALSSLEAKAFLLEYYSVGLRLCKLEGKVVPDYNTTFELNQVIEWDEQLEVYKLNPSMSKEEVKTLSDSHYSCGEM